MAGPTKPVMTCAKCAYQNPMGRMFCVNCGAKMDLVGGPGGNVVMRSTLNVSGALRGIIKVVSSLVVIVGGVVALTLVPQTSRIGVEGNRSGPAEVASLSRATRQLARGQQVGKRISEADLNGFFRDGKTREMNVDDFSVDIKGDRIRLRMVRRLARMDVGSWRLQPKVSYELVVVPVGDKLRFVSARKGLVPMIGPFKTAVIRQFHRRITMLEEWSLCASIRDIQTGEDALDIVFER